MFLRELLNSTNSFQNLISPAPKNMVSIHWMCMEDQFTEGRPPPHAFQMLQDENLQLRTQIQELEKRVSDLTATNEFLLDQNAQLRSVFESLKIY